MATRQYYEGTYFDWIRHVFDHPVTNSAWHWDLKTETTEPAPPECVAYLTRLFEEPEILTPYSDAQVNQGFWYLVSNSCSSSVLSGYKSNRVLWLGKVTFGFWTFDSVKC